MKKKLLTLLCIFWAYQSFAQNNQRPLVNIPSVPTTTEEFITLRNKIATTPEGGAAMFVLAMQLYVKKPEMGMECVISMVDLGALQQSNKGYKGYDLGTSTKNLFKSQLSQAPHIPFSYYKDTSPKDGYKASPPFKVETSINRYSGTESEGKLKVFVKSSGADTPRPITLKKNDKGVWKATEWSSLIVGVRKPVVIIKDDL
jgi:hypothetical protein